jgi:hypothetical protein
MEDRMVIAVDCDCARIFHEYIKESKQEMIPVEHKSFTGGVEIVEFIVELTPHFLTAFTAYLIAKMQYSGKEIVIKKGKLKLVLKNTDLTPADTMELFKKLEQK